MQRMGAGVRALSRWGCCVLGVVAFCAVLWPRHDLWFYGDDFTYVRWVLEHRADPGAAFGSEVFRHLRPATLLAWYAGLWVSGGAWWGGYLVNALGVASSFIAASAWAWTLSGRRLAGVLTGLLLLGEGCVSQLLGWSSWINASWECALSFAGLALSTLAIRRLRWSWMIAALGCFVGAGLFREHGWIVGPVTLALFSVRYPLGRHRLGMLSLVLATGGLGFALTHHGANISRYGNTLQGLGRHLLDEGPLYGDMLLGMFPFGLDLYGLPLILLVAAMVGGVRRGLPGLLAIAAVTAVLLLIPAAGFVSLWVGIVVLLLWKWRRPPAALLALSIHLIIMLLAPMGAQHGHTWGALAALAVFVGVECERWWSARPRRWELALGLTLLLVIVARIPFVATAEEPPTARRARLDRSLVQAVAELSKRGDAAALCLLARRARAPMSVLPLYRLEPEGVRPGPGSAEIAVNGEVLLALDRPLVFDWPKDPAKASPHTPMALPRGSYVLVWQGGESGGESASPPVGLRGSCGSLPIQDPGVSDPEQRWVASTFEVTEDCAPVAVRVRRGSQHANPWGVIAVDQRVEALPEATIPAVELSSCR